MPRTERESADPYKHRKRPRKNASRACDACKARKTRCNGAQPCARCQLHNRQCKYEAPYLRSQVPPKPIAAASGGDEEESDEASGAVASEAGTEDVADVEGFLGSSSNIAFSHAARVELSGQASNENVSIESADDLTHDVHRDTLASEKMRATRSRLYFSEPPFLELDLTTYSLPNTEHGLEICSWYFDNACPTYRFFHRPTVERLVRQLCEPNEWLGSDFDGKKLDVGERCTVLMCWALGCQYPIARSGKVFSSRERDWLRQKGQEYYQASRLMLDKENFLIDRLSILHVRFLMSWYLATTSRLKEAWDLFAVVKNMAVNLDLNKPSPPAGKHASDSAARLHGEQRNRTFWSVYILDTHLGAMLGKLVPMDERDIKIDISITDDSELPTIEDGRETRWVQQDHKQHPSLMLAPRFQAMLAIIIRRALRKLYLDHDGHYDIDTVSQLGIELDNWGREVSSFLDTNEKQGMPPMHARQKSALRLAQQHATIIVYRESLSLSSLAKSPESASTTSELDTIVRQHQDRCLDAAFAAHETLVVLLSQGGITNTHWNSLYLSFCAATVMMFCLGQNAKILTRSRREEILAAAKMSCEVQKKCSRNNFLARRYVVALDALLDQLTKRLAKIPEVEIVLPEQSVSADAAILQSSHQGWTTNLSTHGQAWGSSYYFGNPAAVSGIANSMPIDMGFTMESFFPGTYDNSSFFDLDSLVAGGGFIHGSDGYQ